MLPCLYYGCNFWQHNMATWPATPQTRDHTSAFGLGRRRRRTRGCSFRSWLPWTLTPLNCLKTSVADQYLNCNKVNRILIKTLKHNCLYFKACIEFCQSLKVQNHRGWVLVWASGEMVTAGCSCVGVAIAAAFLGNVKMSDKQNEESTHRASRASNSRISATLLWIPHSWVIFSWWKLCIGTTTKSPTGTRTWQLRTL